MTSLIEPQFCSKCDSPLTVDGMCSSCEDKPKYCVCPTDKDMKREEEE